MKRAHFILFVAVAFAPAGMAAQDDSIELELNRGGTITGRLVDPDGRVVSHHSVLATLTRGSESVGSTTTDSNGKFAITGLQAGDYRVHTLQGAEFRRQVILGEQVSTGSLARDFILKRYTLMVSVVDHTGQPVHAKANHGDAQAFGSSGASVFCHPVALHEGEWWSSPWSEARGRHLFAEVDAEREFVLSVLSPNHRIQEQRILLRPDEYSREVVVQLPYPIDSAAVHIVVTAPDDEELEGPLTYRVKSAEGHPLIEWEQKARELGPTSIKLPPGRYVVSVEESLGKRTKRYVAAEQTIELVQSERKEVTLELGASGSIGALAEIAGPPDPLKLQEPLSLREELHSIFYGPRSGLVDVELVPLDGGKVLHMTFASQGRLLQSHTPPVRGLPPGSKLRSAHRLPLGEYKARLLLPGYEPFEKLIRIEERKCTWIKGTLIPRRRSHD